MVTLSIVVLSYNTKDLTLACIGSLAFLYKEKFQKGEFELIVLDNASSDGSIRAIRKATTYLKHVTIVENSENVGFAAGSNNGAIVAKGKYLLFLNSDTLMEAPILQEMISFLESHKNVAVVSGNVRNFDGSEQLSAGSFPSVLSTFLFLLGSERILRQHITTARKVDWVSGGFMMVRKKEFEDIGGFDKRYFMYIEDMDICFRLSKAGFDTWVLPNVWVLHKGQGSSSRTFAIVQIYEGLLLFYRQHKSAGEYFLIQLLLRIKAILAIGIGIIFGKRHLIETYSKALRQI